MLHFMSAYLVSIMFRRCIVLLAFLGNGITFQNNLISDINSLSEMPLEKLLHVKHSLDYDSQSIDVNEGDGEQVIAAKLDTSQAQALHGKLKPYQRGSYETWQQKKGSDKKGLSKLFQITVTALAFLAFAGYLLCLLVQAIRAKQNATATGTTGAATVYLAPVRRRRPIRQRREIWPEADPDMLYYALKTFSEGYATYHTIDYKYYNRTVNNLDLDHY